MRARPQRTHYMGQSNRNSSSVIDNNHSKMNNNKTMDILQKSFNKTRSQYYRTTFSNNKINPINRGGSLLYSNNTNKNINDSHCNSIMKQQKGYSSQLNINTIYKNGQKGHHYQFENTKFMNNKKPYLINSNNNNYKINNKNNNNNINIKDKDNLPYEQDQKQPLINPPPINMNTKLNSSITQIKQILMNNIRNKNNNEQNSQYNKKNNSNNSQYPQQEINLYKIKQLKKVFLRNNEKRRNLKEYFQKYVNKQTGKVDKNGFKKLIKQYGYDINDTETKLIFGLNSAVHQTHKNNNNINNNNNNINNINNINNNNNNINNNNYNKNNINNINKININQIDLPQFINLMTKQNIYFQTLKLSSQQQHDKNKQQQSFINKNSFEFTPAEFQIFRNKYPKLKQALKIYKNQPITIEKFQKVMKKLDITDLVLKQQKRLQIFNQFSSKNNNHHGIQQLNVQKLLGVIATQQHQRISNQKQMRLTNHDQFQQNIQVNQQYKFQKFNQNDPLLQLLYPKNLKTSSFVDYQKSVKQARDICQCLKNIKKTKSKDIMKSILQNNQNKLPKQLLYKRVQRILQQQGYNFNTNQYKSFISYIDFDQNNNITKQKLQNFIFKEDQPKRVNRLDRRIRNQDKTQKLLPNGQLFGQKNPQNQFIDKIRAKSTVNWNTMKKTFIKDQNIPQFKVPTKFSAWPQRLYQTDFSLVQAKSSVGMGINEQSRFLKEQKHSFAHQDRLKRLLNYQNKVRKVAQWQQINNKRIQQISKAQQKKQQSKLYNMRLLKEEYENRCHSKSFVQ